jgi:hypothetical protein
MARRRIIEGKWNCTSCDTKGILGRHKRCPSCGNPREENSESNFNFGEQSSTGKSMSKTVTDSDVLELATAGRDWFCSFCESANIGNKPTCTSCGASRELESESKPPDSQTETGTPKGQLSSFLTILLFSLISCCCGFGWWADQAVPGMAKVVEKSWERTIEPEQFVTVTLRAWKSDLQPIKSVMPVNGVGEIAGVENIKDCFEKQRGVNRVPIGTEVVCRTETRSIECGTTEQCTINDLGNGMAEEVCDDVVEYCDEEYEDCHNETQYREDPIYEQYCSYDTFQWKKLPTISLAKKDDNPQWPAIDEQRNQRFIKTENYTVHMTVEHQEELLTWDYQTISLQEFQRYQVTQKVDVEITNLDIVRFPKE